MSEHGLVVPAKGFELLLIKEFFDSSTTAKIFKEMRSAPAAAATIYKDGPAGVVDVRTRSASRLSVQPETIDLVTRLLLEKRSIIGEHFGRVLKAVEAPQFLRYRAGDFFVAHQDGNTGMIRSESEEFRKISVSIFLNDESESAGPDTHQGGSLVFHPRAAASYRLRSESGTLAAFRAETTHEVIPVISGERYSIACWYG